MSARALTLFACLAATSLMACSAAENPSTGAASTDETTEIAAPKFPPSLSAIDGTWKRVAGAGFVGANLSPAEMAAALGGVEPIDQWFTVKDGVGRSRNEAQGEPGDEEYCDGDREIRFSVAADGTWSVVEAAPRIDERSTDPEMCNIYVGYFAFSKNPLLLERVEFLQDGRLLIVAAPSAGTNQNQRWAQVFARMP